MNPGAKCVLAVEDNPDDLFLLERAFGKAELRSDLRIVRDGLEATEYLEGKGVSADHDRFPTPEVILLDLKMPRMSGFELLEWMRERPAVSQIPVLILTASSIASDVCRAYDSGAFSYHVKPTAFRELVGLVAEIKSGLSALSRGEPAFKGPLTNALLPR